MGAIVAKHVALRGWDTPPSPEGSAPLLSKGNFFATLLLLQRDAALLRIVVNYFAEM
jgi:hypothetical protein